MICKTEVIERLKNEISVITGIPAAELKGETVLSDCGINSMGFVELLIAARKIWNTDLIESGLSAADVKNISALAEKISSGLKENE